MAGAGAIPDAAVMNDQTSVMDQPPSDPLGSAEALPPPHHNDQPPRTPWYRVPIARDREHRLGGVLAGVCRAYGFDRRTTRIAVVIAAIMLPVLVIVYVAAWALLPAADEAPRSIEAVIKDRSRLPIYAAVGLVLIVGGLGSFGSWFIFGGFPWGLGLIAIGVLLWAVPISRWGRQPVPAGDAPAMYAPDGTTDDATSTGFRAASVAVPPRPPVRRWPVASVALLAVVAGVALAQVGENLDWWNVDAAAVVMVALGAMLVASLASMIVNRRWFLVPLATVFAGALFMFGVMDPNLDGPTGDRTLRPTTVEDLAGRKHLAAGQLTIDLRGVTFGETPSVLQAEVGFGRLHVIVPEDVRVEVSAEFGAGVLFVNDDEIANGLRTNEDVVIQPVGEVAGVVVLDLRVGGGQIDIDRSDLVVISR
jgi:phage shock protein PspC (stress-responsive transcriptional regulator)